MILKTSCSETYNEDHLYCFLVDDFQKHAKTQWLSSFFWFLGDSLEASKRGTSFPRTRNKQNNICFCMLLTTSDHKKQMAHYACMFLNIRDDEHQMNNYFCMFRAIKEYKLISLALLSEKSLEYHGCTKQRYYSFSIVAT